MARHCSNRFWAYLKTQKLALLVTAIFVVYLLHHSIVITPNCDHSNHHRNPFENVGTLNVNPLRDRYLVDSPACKIPALDPWHESLREMIKPLELSACSNLPHLTEVLGDSLSVVKANKKFYSAEGDVNCFYQGVTRGDPNAFGNEADYMYTLSNCLPVEESVTLNPEEQFILVRCSRGNRTVYSNMHARVTLQENVRRKVNKGSSEEKKMSVLMIGIDSVSRLNLIRTMPRTLSFLRDTGWVEIKGYNKVHDATFSNVMAVLTGMNNSQVARVCKYDLNPLDECPVIWKNFSDIGYVTGFGDDGVDGGLFSKELKGFTKQPTDLYLRPFMIAGEKEMTLKYKDNSFICLGPTLTVDHVYKYVTDFTASLRGHPYFGLFWTTSLSHDDISTSAAMDFPVLKLLQSLKKNGVFNDTFVVFFSDHGMRYGEVRTTHNGWLEERLPMNFIWVPEWFRNLHPEKYSNLLANRDKLTSTFDLHLTLKEILYGSPQQGAVSCPECVSLFQPVPWNRSCDEAGILPHYCTCSLDRRHFLPTDHRGVKEMADVVINEINSSLDKVRNRTQNNTDCARLSLHKITALWSYEEDSDKFMVAFETVPGRATFEASVRHSGESVELLGPVSRTNKYGRQSFCIRDIILKMYCFCVTT